MFQKNRERSIQCNIEQPIKSSVRTRYIDPNRIRQNNNSSQSIKKDKSVKYLKQISPKRDMPNSKSIRNNIIKFLESYDQEEQKFQLKQNYNNQHQSQFGILKPSTFGNIKNVQTSRSACKTKLSKKQNKTSQQKQALIDKLQANQKQIILLRQKLQKIYQTYKQRSKQIKEMKSTIKKNESIQNENITMRNQIGRIQQMIKQALLERQKIRHGQNSPFNQISSKRRLK